MHIKIVLPLLTVMVTQMVSLRDCCAQVPDQKSAVQSFCETIYQEWFRLHSKAAHKGEQVQADIMFDPESRVVMLTRGGKEN